MFWFIKHATINMTQHEASNIYLHGPQYWYEIYGGFVRNSDKQLAPAVHERLTGSIYLIRRQHNHVDSQLQHIFVYTWSVCSSTSCMDDLCMHIVVLCLVNTHIGMCGYNYHCVLCSTVVNDSRMPLWYIDIRCCRTDFIQSHCKEIK